MDYDKLLPLIDAIYSAAADPSQWPSVACQIQHSIGGHSVNLVLEDTQNPKFQYIYTNGVTQPDIERYESNIIGGDEFCGILDKIQANTALLTQHFWKEKQLHAHYPYEEFYEELGYDYFNVALFYRDTAKRGWLSVVRDLKSPLFTANECELMQALLPHLQRAFLINVKMIEAQYHSEFCLNSLEHLSSAVLLLSTKGHILKYNTKAQKYLCRIDTTKQSLRVHLSDTKANCQLDRLVRATLYCDDVGFGGIVPFFEHGIRKTVLCFPWRSTNQQMDWLGQAIGCILFILSPSDEAPPAHQLQQTFNLSKAEVRVLQGLLDGTAVSALADQFFITEATVRFHIRNLLRKTDSRNQAELISKVFKMATVLIE